MKLLTLARDLTRRKARERQGLFVAEGVRAVEEVLRSTLPVRGVVVGPSLAANPRADALLARLRELGHHQLEVGEADFASAAATDSPQGVLAIAEAPTYELSTLYGRTDLRLLVLDGVQDPGNVGTILRTAAALGTHGVVALPGTVDLGNAKVVRSAMGALFHRPSFVCTWDELDAFRARQAVSLWAADADGEPLESELLASVPDRLALVVGNEGAGISADARRRADRMVALPITDAVESLNVAVAAGILLYVLRR